MQNNYKKPYKKDFNNNFRNQKPLSPEEKFEKMIAEFLKDSKDKLCDISKGEDRKRPDKKYKQCPDKNKK